MVNAVAAGNNLDNEVSGSELRQTLCQSSEGSVVFPNSMKAGNVDIELYCVYANKNEVLNEINEKYSETIQFVKQNYDIEEDLNKDNWQDYRNAMINVSVDFPDVDSTILFNIAEIDGDFVGVPHQIECVHVLHRKGKHATRQQHQP